MREETSILGLTTIRKNRGVSLEEIAKATKISVRSLEAIERGDFRKLPGGIYNTSYIRQYARAIDYDEGILLDYYRRHMSGEAPRTTAQNGNGNFGGFRPASTIAGS